MRKIGSFIDRVEAVRNIHKEETKMKVIDARIRWNNGWANTPTLEVLVDKIPIHEDLLYEESDCGNHSKAYYAEQGGYVDFLFHDPTNEEGYGGRTFTIRVATGEKGELPLTWKVKRVKGPWSSRSSAMYEVFGRKSCEVSITDRIEDFERGYTFFSGHITGKLFEETMARFFPEVEWNFGPAYKNDDEKSYVIVKPRAIKESPHGQKPLYEYKGGLTTIDDNGRMHSIIGRK